MKKIILVIFILIMFFWVVGSLSDKNENTTLSTTTENDTSVSSSTLTLAERNAKLISAMKGVDGTLDADVRNEILTIQFASVSPEEAQKIAESVFVQIKKYKENEHIKTVIVCDINYKLLGYAGAKK